MADKSTAVAGFVPANLVRPWDTHIKERVMLKSTIAVLVLIGFTFLPRSWAGVTNAVVGTCQSGTSYSSIQSAINAAQAGSTVQICPGTYVEVLTINKNLNLKGIAYSTSSGAADSVNIGVPSSGVPQNASSGIWGNLAVQVLVENATAHFSNLVIDGGGGSNCSITPVGVLFQGASGSMTNSTFQDPPQCTPQVSALLDHTTNFNFSTNYLRDCRSSCLEIDYGSNTTVEGNDVTSVPGSIFGISTQNLAGPITISSNIVSGLITFGIAVELSPSATVMNNLVMADVPSGAGIFLGGATQALVQNNRLRAPSGVLIDDGGAVGNNTVTKNTMMGGLCGLQINSSNQGDTTIGNTYISELQTVCLF